MASRVLPRQLRRDLWRHRWQFLAAAVVIAIGVGVYVGASDAYLNLKDSFARAYVEQRLPDAIVSGAGSAELAAQSATLPGAPVATTRRQGNVGIRIDGHALRGRAVEVPVRAQPEVARLSVRAGRLPGPGEVLVEQHLADHYGLRPGDSVEVLTAAGWSRMRVSGAALSAEYFWPARSTQEIMTTPEHFGVLFTTADDLSRMATAPLEQTVLYATDRSQSAALLDAATRWGEARGLSVIGRDEQASYSVLDEDVQAVGEFADLLPWVFLLAAVLGTYVLLSRLVAAQRAVIGTLAANGVSARTLRRHYLGYGLAVGLLGAGPGLVIGYLLGRWFTTAYTSALSLPLQVTSVHPRHLLVGALFALVAAALAAWSPARSAAATTPAEAMRISPPHQAGRRTLLERLVPPARRLPARWRMTLRGLSRNRRRSLFTIIGVAVAVLLVMVFAGLRDTVATVIDRQYGSIQLEDAEVHTAPGADLVADISSQAGVRRAETFNRYDVTLTGPDGNVQTLLTALEPGTRMHRFTTTEGTHLSLPAKGILMPAGTHESLGLDRGDPVEVRASGGPPVDLVVAGFLDEPLNPVAYTALPQAQALQASPAATGVLVQLTDGASPGAVAQAIGARTGVTAYLATSTVKKAMTDAFALYDTLVGLMLLFAAAMAAALLYNAMSANVAERSVELGTLRTAGMGTGMMGRMVAAENLLLVLVGIPVGLVVGTWTADWFMSTYETQGSHWSLTMSPLTPAIVAVGVLLAAILIQAPALRSMRRLDLARIVRERSL
ncbi:MAG TPA: FtsX-like permease family protein [Marmoricola sp.]|nr:FtsX-like permease family protein [Marmoricola sp.]